MSIYNKLADRSIRLLDLYPGEPNSPLQGSLRTAILDPPEFYEALSYTWGAPETAAFLHVETGSVPLTLNLVQALLRLRRKDTIRTIWIDQICINQNDIEERGQQVSLMGDIYRGASMVDIWLGEEDSDTSEGMLYIPHLLKSFTHSEERDETGDEVPHVLEVLGLLTIKSPRWIALRSLFERPYFRRMWIVQEVALGKKCVVYCGSHSVPWNNLAKAALCLEDDADHQADAHRVVRMIGGLKRMNVTGYSGHRPLMNLIHQSFNLLCTNPRDKIYGVLGLASDIMPEQFSPDYSLSVQDVYLATTIFCMRRYKSLEVLCQVRHPKLLPGMPSWVPDWTVMSAPRESLASKFGERYFAGGKEGPVLVLRLSDDKRTLYANGKLVDKIQQVGSVMLDLAQDVENKNRVLSEWRQYARKASPYFTGETYPTIFWRTLLADGDTRGKSSDNTRQQLYEAHQNLIDRNTGTFDGLPTSKPWEQVAEMSIVNSRSLEFERLMNAACLGRRIAITEQGFLGLVPSEAQLGDELVILETVRVPLVFRRVEFTTDHSSVGECYLQGGMDGALYNGSSGEDLQFSIM
jgi:hypothetical protein